MKWLQIICLMVGMLALSCQLCAAQSPTTLPAEVAVQPVIPGDLTREDIVKILVKLQAARGETRVVEGLTKIKAYVDNENRKQSDAVRDLIGQEEQQDEQDLALQRLRDQVQDEARSRLKLWALEKFLERRRETVIESPAPFVQYRPQPQYVPQPRSGCAQGRRLSVTVGVSARKSFFGNKVILKPILGLN